MRSHPRSHRGGAGWLPGTRGQLKAQSTAQVHRIEIQRRGLTKENYKGAPLQPLTLVSEGATGGLMRHIQ
ncbi:hypothetical protein NDU88_010104 [Pleurodeles waltl]|uniref:Uncharacterized protein n=1 Tax=Pleurodeles waltl TaxID=8319 RepID=A0AAV7S0B9_PLEWA|nr:hypothetical protein NDU88_010104 [Pleurodeles waltl]